MALVIATAILLVLTLILSIWDKSKLYPYLIYIIAILSLYQTTLLGVGVVGSDIQLELYYARQALANGWNFSLQESQSNLSVITGLIAPSLSRLLNIDLVRVFKWIFPAIFALTPVVLYFAFRKVTNERVALYASLFFIMIPVFNMEIAANVKSMVAELFLAIAILVMVSDYHNLYKAIVFTLCIIIALVSHYTVGIMLILYFCGITLLLMLIRPFKDKLMVIQTVPVKVFLIPIAISAVIGFVYFYFVGNGMLLKTLDYIANWIVSNISNVFVVKTVAVPTVTVGQMIAPDPVTVAPATTYLQQQPQFVRSALGFDFFETSLLGKLFRIMQYFTQFMIVVGVFYCLITKRFKSEFMCGCLVAIVILGLCILVPNFSMIANMTRFYHMSLFFLALCFAVAFDMFRKYKVAIMLPVLFIYYIFVSGIAFEITKVPDITKLQVPYSYALSAERTGSMGIYTESDLECARWLAEESDPDVMVDGDQNAVALVSSYMWYYPRILDQNQQHAGSNRDRYLLLTDWNNRHNKLVKAYGFATGLRGIEQIPDLKDATQVYVSQNSSVYLVKAR